MAHLHAHTPHPILHRDLKSANVMLNSDAARTAPVAKIGDFGPATGAGSGSTTAGHALSSVSATRHGGGTCAYKAPEARRS